MNHLKSNQDKLLEPIIFFDGPPADYMKNVSNRDLNGFGIVSLIRDTVNRLKSIELNYQFPRDLSIKTSFSQGDYYGRNYQF